MGNNGGHHGAVREDRKLGRNNCETEKKVAEAPRNTQGIPILPRSNLPRYRYLFPSLASSMRPSSVVRTDEDEAAVRPFDDGGVSSSAAAAGGNNTKRVTKR